MLPVSSRHHELFYQHCRKLDKENSRSGRSAPTLDTGCNLPGTLQVPEKSQTITEKARSTTQEVLRVTAYTQQAQTLAMNLAAPRVARGVRGIPR